jgi:hypothetical protein
MRAIFLHDFTAKVFALPDIHLGAAKIDALKKEIEELKALLKKE